MPFNTDSKYPTRRAYVVKVRGDAKTTRWPVVSRGHEDMSDHRFEQRGLLHVKVQAHGRPIHVIVLHLGLIAGSRVRQVEQLTRYIGREVPRREALVVAGDLNDWGAKLRPVMKAAGLHDFIGERQNTFPSRLPLAQLDFVYARGLKPVGIEVPKGRIWWRMSDHLPLIAEFKV